MKADLTRNTFDHFKHYVRVLMQQGRVQLDADWNEQVSILLHYLQTLAEDLIGPAGGPAGLHYGFEISALMKSMAPPLTDDFRIGLGRYYVNGILCEAESTPVALSAIKGNEILLDTWSLDGAEFQKEQYVEIFDADPASNAAPVMAQITDSDKAQLRLTLKVDGKIDAKNPRLRRVISYLTQPDYPAPEALAAGGLQVYLDVWERHITYVQDDHIREVALGGPDTTTRSKVVWQVKVTPSEPTPAGEACMTPEQLKARFQPEPRGRLKAMAKRSSSMTDPCIIPPEARYTGPENQLYRVEIHTGGTLGDKKPPTFKWSRENGAVFFPIVSGGDSSEVTLENLGRDDRFGLAVGDWVEIQDDRSVLHTQLNYQPANLLQVQAIDRATLTVTLSGTPDKNVGGDPALHPLLRRWDQKAGDPEEGGLTIQADGAALIVEDKDTWLTLEDGVQIQFQPSAGKSKNIYRTGDYWLIPARTATGDVEWPRVLDPQGNPEVDAQGNPMPIALPPAGIYHHYAPLAVINLAKGQFQECRKPFGPLAGA
jgi:Family of unknown function (DUF6519)